MPKKRTARDDELSTRPKIRERLIETFRDIDKGFQDQNERSDATLDYWECYNCKLGDRQFYSGNSEIFVPIVRSAIKARKTRFVNQIFPQSGRNVEVVTTDGNYPYATMALLEHYVRKLKLRTEVVPSLVVNGDVEGQYSLYVGWRKTTRHVVTKTATPVKIGGLEYPEHGEIEDIDEDEIEDAGPYVEVILDNDLMVLPVTVDRLENALAEGGSVTIRRRWSKGRIRQMIDDGEFEEEQGEILLKAMTKREQGARNDTTRELASAAGIKISGEAKYCLGYETFTRLKVDGKYRTVRAYFGGDKLVLGAKLNPYWSDRVPVISGPVEKVAGVFKGRSPVADVIDTQVLANDMVNEGADTAHFAAMPIIMTDPEKNPRVGSMVLGLAAIWETNPKDTSFASFPALWKDCLTFVGECKNEIFQVMGVNPSMIPQATGGKRKMNQAEIANEQQVDILTTADAVTNLEEQILSPLLEWIAELDHQFRDKELLVRGFGEMGMKANMEDVPPIQLGRRWTYRWYGVEAARTASLIQQQIAMFNVAKAIPPQLYQGYRLDAAPAMKQMFENAFGPRIAPLIFKSIKDEMTVDPKLENQMLSQGFDVAVHTFDNDAEHLKVHMELLGGANPMIADPTGAVRAHVMAHQMQMQMKNQAQAKAMGGLAGSPGGSGPGVAGTPQPGSQPQGPKLVRGAPGAINQDRMAAAGDPGTMPR